MRALLSLFSWISGSYKGLNGCQTKLIIKLKIISIDLTVHCQPVCHGVLPVYVGRHAGEVPAVELQGLQTEVTSGQDGVGEVNVGVTEMVG